MGGLDFAAKALRERKLGDVGRMMQRRATRTDAFALPHDPQKMPGWVKFAPRLVRDPVTFLDTPAHLEYYGPEGESPLEVYTVGRNSADYARRYKDTAPRYGALDVLNKPEIADRPVTNIDTQLLSGEGGGTPLYLRAWADIEREGAMNVPHSLSPLNQDRRTSNMISRILRGGDPRTVILSPEQKLVPLEGSDPAAPRSLWATPREFDELPTEVKLGMLAEAELRNVALDMRKFRKMYPEESVYFPGLGSTRGVFRDISNLLHTKPGLPDSGPRSSSVGDSSLRRAAWTRELLRDPTTELPDELGRGIFKRRGGLATLPG